MVAALLRPWQSARTWRELAHLCTDVLVGTVTFTVMVTLLATSLGLAIVARWPCQWSGSSSRQPRRWVGSNGPAWRRPAAPDSAPRHRVSI